MIIKIVLLFTIFLVVGLCVSHYRQSEVLSAQVKSVHRICHEDVESRLQEARMANCPLVRYRKLREAHASLETMSAMVGGYNKLLSFGINAVELDTLLYELETDTRKDIDMYSNTSVDPQKSSSYH